MNSAADPQTILHHYLKRAASILLPETVLVVRGPSRARRVALTFDDGPDELTGAYLDALDAYGAYATFFVTGDACQRRPADLHAMLRRGHQVASHGMRHKIFTSLTRAELIDELRLCQEFIPPRGSRPMVRPPHGAVSPGSLYTCSREGYTTVLWSLDSCDYRDHDAETVINRLTPARLRSGEIILLHEGQAWTLAALPRILSNLRAAGFEMVTIEDLLS